MTILKRHKNHREAVAPTTKPERRKTNRNHNDATRKTTMTIARLDLAPRPAPVLVLEMQARQAARQVRWSALQAKYKAAQEQRAMEQARLEDEAEKERMRQIQLERERKQQVKRYVRCRLLLYASVWFILVLSHGKTKSFTPKVYVAG
jgi:hypothetical protein